MTIQLKAVEQYFSVVLFIPLHKVRQGNLRWYSRWSYLLSLWIESWSVTIQLKGTERYFPWGAVYYAVQGGSNF